MNEREVNLNSNAYMQCVSYSYYIVLKMCN